MNDRDTRIRQRAYNRWEREGRPSGRDIEHWLDAEREEDQGISNRPADEESEEQSRLPPRLKRKQGAARPS